MHSDIACFGLLANGRFARSWARGRVLRQSLEEPRMNTDAHGYLNAAGPIRGPDTFLDRLRMSPEP